MHQGFNSQPYKENKKIILNYEKLCRDDILYYNLESKFTHKPSALWPAHFNLLPIKTMLIRSEI